MPQRKAPKGLFANGVVSVMEFASLIKLHQSYIRKLIKCRMIRFAKVGRRVLIPRSEVDRLLEERLT